MSNDSNTKNSLFIAGEGAPEPINVANLFVPIPRRDGRMALTEISIDTEIPGSHVELRLDDNPRLNIYKGIGKLVMGHTDPETGHFMVNEDQEVGRIQVTGTYTGAGSLLRIYQLVQQAKKA